MKNRIWIVFTIGWICITIQSQFNISYGQIIGSSVVTSVSVVLGNDEATTPPPSLPTTPTHPSIVSSSPSNKIIVHYNSSSEPGILHLIASLKSIVKEEENKINNNKSTTTTTHSTTHSTTTVVDDEEEDQKGKSEIKSNGTTTIGSSQTSGEIQEAITKISDALLTTTSGNKTQEPVQNILHDVLHEINRERHNGSGNDPNPLQVSTQTPTTTVSTKVKGKNTTTGVVGVDLIEIGPVVVVGNSKIVSDESNEKETEEEFWIISTTIKPKEKITKKPQFQYHNNKPNKKNTSKPNTRPTEFYDDEIFGFDPYQTFAHGIYSPNQGDAPSAPVGSPHHYHIAQMRPPVTHSPLPNYYPPLKLSQSNTGVRKRLPDHLHRPRPSHLQYQHTAAESIDTETGLTNVKVSHPSSQQSQLSPDKLTLMPKTQSNTNTVTPSPYSTTTTQRPITTQETQTTTTLPQKQDENPIFSNNFPGNPGLEATVTSLDPNMKQFLDINNKIGLKIFGVLTKESINLVLSPFTILSTLGALFLGGRGTTAAQIDSLLHIDDQLSFNPHLMYHNISKGFLSQQNTATAIVRLIMADKRKGEVLEFYKMRVQHFYDARVEEADYKYAGHMAQSILNQMIRAQIQKNNYEITNSSLQIRGPLSLVSATYFDGEFNGESCIEDLDFIDLGDLSRSLVRVPSVCLIGPWRGVYSESMEVTGVEVGYKSRDLSLLLILPGKLGEFPIGGIEKLKNKLTLEGWSTLMRGFQTMDSYRIIFPKFRISSSLNLTSVLYRLGIRDPFLPNLAKFSGINGRNDLYLDKHLLHFSEFSTHQSLNDGFKSSGLKRILPDWIFKSRTPAHVLNNGSNNNYSTSLPPITYTKIRSSGKKDIPIVEPFQNYRKTIQFDRPFLYFLRHNPTGAILISGQYINPSLN